ncbi:MAG: rhodanese-like domain-containing protein [Desulfococcaceae bacterium]
MKKALNTGGYEVTDIVWPDLPDTHLDITAEEAEELIRDDPYLYIVDVREYEVFCGPDGHIPYAENYPWDSGVLEEYYTDFPEGSAVLLVSGDGYLSNSAALFLENKGLYLYDMTGGMEDWIWETELCETAEPDDPDYEDGGGGGGCFIRVMGF